MTVLCHICRAMLTAAPIPANLPLPPTIEPTDQPSFRAYAGMCTEIGRHFAQVHKEIVLGATSQADGLVHFLLLQHIQTVDQDFAFWHKRGRLELVALMRPLLGELVVAPEKTHAQ